MTESRIFRAVSILLIVLLVALAGCMNVRKAETVGGEGISKEQFLKKSVAVLPVKAQTALTTDSILSLRTTINEKLDDKLKTTLPYSKIIDTKTSVDVLNNKNKLNVLDDLIKVYDNTGVFDKRLVDSLASSLQSDYVVFSRLKAEKMSVGVLGKGFGASLEVMILGRANKDVVWAGSGEFKRGGIFGFGTTENKQAADELIRLAFLKF